MKILAGKDRDLILSELYLGVGIETDAGMFAVCMRDNGIEIRLGDGPWYSWQDATGPVNMETEGKGEPDPLPNGSPACAPEKEE